VHLFNLHPFLDILPEYSVFVCFSYPRSKLPHVLLVKVVVSLMIRNLQTLPFFVTLLEYGSTIFCIVYLTIISSIFKS